MYVCAVYVYRQYAAMNAAATDRHVKLFSFRHAC